MKIYKLFTLDPYRKTNKFFQISISKQKGIIEEFLYDRRAYETVDDKIKSTEDR